MFFREAARAEGVLIKAPSPREARQKSRWLCKAVKGRFARSPFYSSGPPRQPRVSTSWIMSLIIQSVINSEPVLASTASQSLGPLTTPLYQLWGAWRSRADVTRQIERLTRRYTVSNLTFLRPHPLNWPESVSSAINPNNKQFFILGPYFNPKPYKSFPIL